MSPKARGSHLGVSSRGTAGLDALLRSPGHHSRSSLSDCSPRTAGLNPGPGESTGSARARCPAPGGLRWALRTALSCAGKRRAREGRAQLRANVHR